MGEARETISELGSVACLTVSGVSPLAAAAATLLYQLFTFFLVIPVELVVAVLWGLARRRPRLAARSMLAATASGMTARQSV